MLKSWNYNFFGKKANFPVNKRFWPSFQLLSNITKTRNFFWGTTRCVWRFFAIDKSLSLGPKRSVARIFSKISCTHGDKRFWLTFLKNINCDKPLRTVCKCSKGFSTTTMEIIRSFLQHMRGCWKHNFLKKKAIFPVRKKIMAPFFSFYQKWQTSKDGL